MRIAVIGAGGVGGYFGGKLAQAGHDVTFVARGRHLAALRERGIVVESSLGNATIRTATFTDDLAQVGGCDVVMLCVKLWDVEAVAPRLAPLLADGGVVIPFQNGVAAPDILIRALSPRRVLGGIAYIAATIREPGVIAHTGTMARLVVGAFEGGNGDAAAAFRDACVAAGVDAARCGRSSASCRRCRVSRRWPGCRSAASATIPTCAAHSNRRYAKRGVWDAHAGLGWPTTIPRDSSPFSIRCRHRCARRC